MFCMKSIKTTFSGPAVRSDVSRRTHACKAASEQPGWKVLGAAGGSNQSQNRSFHCGIKFSWWPFFDESLPMENHPVDTFCGNQSSRLYVFNNLPGLVGAACFLQIRTLPVGAPASQTTATLVATEDPSFQINRNMKPTSWLINVYWRPVGSSSQHHQLPNIR